MDCSSGARDRDSSPLKENTDSITPTQAKNAGISSRNSSRRRSFMVSPEVKRRQSMLLDSHTDEEKHTQGCYPLSHFLICLKFCVMALCIVSLGSTNNLYSVSTFYAKDICWVVNCVFCRPDIVADRSSSVTNPKTLPRMLPSPYKNRSPEATGWCWTWVCMRLSTLLRYSYSSLLSHRYTLLNVSTGLGSSLGECVWILLCELLTANIGTARFAVKGSSLFHARLCPWFMLLPAYIQPRSGCYEHLTHCPPLWYRLTTAYVRYHLGIGAWWQYSLLDMAITMALQTRTAMEMRSS